MIGICMAILLAACILGAGCVTPEQEPGEYQFNETDSGRTVPLVEGSTIVIRLEENPTTGYLWNATVSGGLEIVDDRFEPSDTSGQLVGSGGIREWTLKAVERGDAAFAAVYHRPWEPVTGTEETFTMAFTIE